MPSGRRAHTIMCWSPERKEAALEDTTTVHSEQSITYYPPAVYIFYLLIEKDEILLKLKMKHRFVTESQIYVMRSLLVEYHLQFKKQYLI
jgi:hypothetical protein